MAHTWTCAQTSGVEINATPAICSLSGSQPGMLSLVVGSRDGMYKIDLYSTTFLPNTSRWPWPTFHRDVARTGCYTDPSTTMVSASIVGQVRDTSGNLAIDAAVYIYFETDGSTSTVPVPRSDPVEYRTDVRSAGDQNGRPEINRGGYEINQLQPSDSFQPSRDYKIKVVYQGTTKWKYNITLPAGLTPLDLNMADM